MFSEKKRAFSWPVVAAGGPGNGGVFVAGVHIAWDGVVGRRVRLWPYAIRNRE